MTHGLFIPSFFKLLLVFRLLPSNCFSIYQFSGLPVCLFVWLTGEPANIFSFT